MHATVLVFYMNITHNLDLFVEYIMVLFMWLNANWLVMYPQHRICTIHDMYVWCMDIGSYFWPFVNDKLKFDSEFEDDTL